MSMTQRLERLDSHTLRLAAVNKRLRQIVKERYALRLYEPNPGPQEEFHRSKKRFRFLFGGNRTGKTTAGAIEALWHAMGMHRYNRKPPASGWVVSPTFEQQRDSAQEKILRYLPTYEATSKPKSYKVVYRDRARGYIDRITIPICSANYPGIKHTTITFKSAEQGQQAFAGASVPWIWLDEEIPLDIYQECLMRVVDCLGSIWGTMTPLEGDLYNMVTEELHGKDPELAYWHVTLYENPYLSPYEIERLVEFMDETEKEARMFGRYEPKSGRVYGKFREEVHVVEPFKIPDSWRKIAGFDHGLRNPTACVWVAMDNDGTVYVYDEHYAAEKSVEWHASNIKKRGIKRIKADPSLWNRQATGKSVEAMYREKGVRLFKAAQGKGTWTTRTELIRQCLNYVRLPDGTYEKKPALYVFSNCKHLIKELRSLIWKPSRTGNTHEDAVGHDHAIDALGYALEDMMPRLGKKASGKPVKAISTYKARNKVTGY